MSKVISTQAITNRKKLIIDILNVQETFGEVIEIIEDRVKNEIGDDNNSILLDYLRICGNIPERYRHDSTAEKIYSKYTDVLISNAFTKIGLHSTVIKERGDAADVIVVGKDYSFVADAKAFRLSRTAKNQKDFKIEAVDGWKGSASYAMVVCPVYQLPNRASQIYQQATVRNVCIFTYSHLALLVNYAQLVSKQEAEKLLFNVFQQVCALNPSKESLSYWTAINKVFLDYASEIEELWAMEKKASQESIEIGKQEGLESLHDERMRILSLDHNEALNALINAHGIDIKINTIHSFTNNNLLSLR